MLIKHLFHEGSDLGFGGEVKEIGYMDRETAAAAQDGPRGEFFGEELRFGLAGGAGGFEVGCEDGAGDCDFERLHSLLVSERVLLVLVLC